MTHENQKYGAMPLENVMRSEFELKGLQSAAHAAHLQYKLLVLKSVIRANVDFAKKRLVVVYTEPGLNSQRIGDALKPVKAILKSRAPEGYDSVVAGSYNV
jgi:hypothetical protein